MRKKITGINCMNLKQLYKILNEYGCSSEGKDYQADYSLPEIQARINEIEQKKLDIELRKRAKEELFVPKDIADYSTINEALDRVNIEQLDYLLITL